MAEGEPLKDSTSLSLAAADSLAATVDAELGETARAVEQGEAKTAGHADAAIKAKSNSVSQL